MQKPLLKKLNDHGLTVTAVKNKIRLFPMRLVNERVIKYVRHYRSQLLEELKQKAQHTCGYSRSFCSCDFSSIGTVTCDACEHFTPDPIGDGMGIGSCYLGIEWTQELKGRMPLYRYAERRCKKYSKLIK